MLKSPFLSCSGELGLLTGFLGNKGNIKDKIAVDPAKPRAVRYGVTDDDYFHHGSAFQPVKTRDKGYFTIHPQFVSENVVELKKLRKKHQKYFGESRVPLF